MSSHREAPEISKDPVADNADVYAFVSPDNPSTVTIISNFVPLQGPAGGPNFFEFGDDVLYSIYIDNNGDAMPEIEYQFQFNSTRQNDDTFLYNTGPIASLTDPLWNSRQLYSVTRIDAGDPHGKGKGNSNGNGGNQGGPAFCCSEQRHDSRHRASMPALQYRAALDAELRDGARLAGGQDAPNRRDGLLRPAGRPVLCRPWIDLRPRQPSATPAGPCRRLDLPDAGRRRERDSSPEHPHDRDPGTRSRCLRSDGSSTPSASSPKAVLGIWSGASRRKVRIFDDQTHKVVGSGPWVQVSRLGNPLFNEVIVPLGKKDEWNGDNPVDDLEYLPDVQHPELARLLPGLYPGAFPNLAALVASGSPRADLAAILLTGIPAAVGIGFQNYTGPTNADMLRLNVGIAPTTTSPNPLGVVGGDLAGFPNGRRVFDDIVTIELRAIAGLTYPLVAPPPGYTVDGVVGSVDDGLTLSSVPSGYPSHFPYVGSPYSGYDAS